LRSFMDFLSTSTQMTTHHSSVILPFDSTDWMKAVDKQTLASCSAYYLIMKMEAVYSSETSVDFQRTTQRYIFITTTIFKIYLYTINFITKYCTMLRRNRIPILLRDVIASARKSCLPVGYLATLCCVIQQWVDMSQYLSLCLTN
jgi:hypothetical protein